ncbi:hypothetical protein KBB85_01145 [Patescibacteria group bacterium]|nr:hypothetical protein [Patescibacteria group bacterium]
MFLAAAMVAVAVWLGWTGSASAQLVQASNARAVVRNGAIQFVPDYGTQLEGLIRVSEGTRSNLRGIRADRNTLLPRVQRGDVGARAELTELECTTACTDGGDQTWCKENHANEWDGHDLTLPCNSATGACTRCYVNGDNGGECQWRRVQAISAFTCSSLRARSWVIRATEEASRSERAAVDLAEVTRQREAARLALNSVSTLLREARERITTLVAEAAARSAAAAVVAEAPRVVQRTVARRNSTRTYRQPRMREMRCMAIDDRRNGLSACRVPAKGLTQLLHSTSFLRDSQIDTPAGMEYFTRHLNANARVTLAQVLEDNPGADGDCRAPVIFYCRSEDRRVTLVRRAGICRAANRSASDMTVESFTALALQHCGTNPRIGVWGVPGHRILLRLRPDAIESAAVSMTRAGTASYARSESPPRLAQYTSYDDIDRTEASPRGSPGNDTAVIPLRRYACSPQDKRRWLAA